MKKPFATRRDGTSYLYFVLLMSIVELAVLYIDTITGEFPLTFGMVFAAVAGWLGGKLDRQRDRDLRPPVRQCCNYHRALDESRR